MNKLFIRLLEKRGFKPSFLEPKYENLSDPFILKDMDKAVSRIQVAIGSDEKILIYGDYDVDGVTSSTLMEETLIMAGVKPENIDIMLPDRFADGYGMSPKLIDHAKKQGATLVITVDCGSRNHAIVEELNTLKIDTIITDHHETESVLPEAVAIINPHRQDAPTESLYNLAGVGVAFMFARALVDKGVIKAGREKWLLDLVLIGTICDSMTLTGENRILGYYGMKVLAKTRRKGLMEIMKKAGVKSLSSESIGFQIGPRLNAAGRLESADLSLNLLRAKTATEAVAIAEKLEQLNKKRKTEQNLATDEIKKRKTSDEPVIIEVGKWHEGIIGIVAGRLVEEYHRPAFVLTEIDGGILKGSGRSFGDFNLAEALNFAKDAILSGGGHAGAAGVKLESSNLYAFREKTNEYYRSLHLENQEKYLKCHADLEVDDFADFSNEFLSDLKLLEPFGPGNEEPVFCLKNIRISKLTRMGSDRNHLRLDLCDSHGKNLKTIAFFAKDSWLSIDPDYDQVEVLVKIVENDFNGVTSVEGRIIDIVYPMV